MKKCLKYHIFRQSWFHDTFLKKKKNPEFQAAFTVQNGAKGMTAKACITRKGLGGDKKSRGKAMWQWVIWTHHVLSNLTTGHDECLCYSKFKNSQYPFKKPKTMDQSHQSPMLLGPKRCPNTNPKRIPPLLARIRNQVWSYHYYPHPQNALFLFSIFTQNKK